MSPNSDNGKLVEILADGKIIIDGSKFSEFLVIMKNNFLENLSKMNLEHISIYLYGISTLMAYRGIVWAYDKGNNFDLSVFKDDRIRLEALKSMQKGRFQFTTIGALGVLMGLTGIIYVNKQYLTNNVNVNINVSSTPSTNNPQNSLIFLYTYFKKLNIWLKLFIIFVLIPITIFVAYPYISYIYMIYINFINKNLLQIKIFICLICVLIILYNIIELYLINIFSKYSEKPKLNKYIPSKISNEIFSLYYISKSNEHDKSLLIGIKLKSLIYFILLFVIILAIFLIF